MNNEQHLSTVIGSREIKPEVWSALKNSLFPGASDNSVVMAWDYCAARGLDIMLKPVHLVPMYIKDKNTGNGGMRDVVMPGIGLYRIQADRSGDYAGMSAPEFGEEKTINLGGVEISFPEWCQISVSKLIGDRIVEFVAREYWLENYATAGKDSIEPNAMWKKRPRAQLVKCTEAQALRKAWPELGSQPTAEEMEGKEQEREVNPEVQQKQQPNTETKQLPIYSSADFDKNFSDWVNMIESGKITSARIIKKLSTMATLTDDQKAQLKAIDSDESGEAA